MATPPPADHAPGQHRPLMLLSSPAHSAQAAPPSGHAPETALALPPSSPLSSHASVTLDTPPSAPSPAPERPLAPPLPRLPAPTL